MLLLRTPKLKVTTKTTVIVFFSVTTVLMLFNSKSLKSALKPRVALYLQYLVWPTGGVVRIGRRPAAACVASIVEAK